MFWPTRPSYSYRKSRTATLGDTWSQCGALATALRREQAPGRQASALLRWMEAVAQTPPSGLSLWQITTAGSRRRSNQSGRAVDHRETALQDLGEATRNARL
jgi:hypothetical protein